MGSKSRKHCSQRGFLDLIGRFSMPRQPLRKLRPELFEEERNAIDAFLVDDEEEIAEV